jgi:hypothetical protein
MYDLKEVVPMIRCKNCGKWYKEITPEDRDQPLRCLKCLTPLYEPGRINKLRRKE